MCLTILLSLHVCVGSFAQSAQTLRRTGQANQPGKTASDRRAAQRNRREQWFLRGRIASGRPAAALVTRAFRKRAQIRSVSSNRSLASSQIIAGNWTALGPLPLSSDASGTGIQDYGWLSGRATAVAIDPADTSGNTVYVGGAYGGLWKSSNAGPASQNPSTVVWTPLIDDQVTLAVGSIAIQPQPPAGADPARSVLLVGTGETNNSTDSYYGRGILRYAGDGTPWTLITGDISGLHSFAGLGFSKIVFSTSNANLAVAAASATTQGVIQNLESPPNVNRGLYYSQDSGVSWTYASVSDGPSSANAIGPSSVTSVVFDATAAIFLAAVTSHGFYSSPDGLSWTRLPVQPGSALSAVTCPAQSVSPSACPMFRGELAYEPVNHGLYAWFVDSADTDGGIWQSLDGGASWNTISDAGITSCGDVFGGCGTSQGTYNLALEAVASGGATDLYAGAVNIYKCTINTLERDCTGAGPNTFLNLTHAYGCSSVAKVHPGQHAMGSMVIGNSQSLIFFANDGGLYRALDGYTGLLSGNCSNANLFDNMNETLGSMTQLVSFSQSQSNQNLFLGGAGDDGFPATAAAEGNLQWASVSTGDGGYTAINPVNDAEWFIASPPDSGSGVNIFLCPFGANCHTLDFQNGQVVTSALVGGDTGPFYLPFILDPRTSSTLLLGTCRLWRGSSAGGTFAPLSNSFEDGGIAPCVGNEVNLVRAIAAGGPADANGFLNVIYAATDGLGPAVASSPAGGRLFVTLDAASGAASWADRTGPVNPGNFPISGIAIDDSDLSGQTAYIAVTGFGGAHVSKTTDAGLHWINFSGNLPDVPANAVLVDKNQSTVYVATDQGVFSSSTVAANWSEVGPAPGNGSTGYLPNAPVTALRIFQSGGTKRLRASTYGRGIWEFNLATAPDFQMAVVNPAVVVFGSQTTTLIGSLASLNNFHYPVAFSCTLEAPAPLSSCTISPNPVTGAPSPQNFALTLAAAIGDYTFNLHAVSTNAATPVQDLPLALRVVDFNLSTPSPASITLAPSSNSVPINLQVTAAGSFNNSVNLSCAGLPAATACSFQPSGPVNPTSAGSVTSSLIINATANAPPGNYSVIINAATSNGPIKTQPLSLNITTLQPDFAMTISNPSLSGAANTSAMFDGILTAFNGYSGVVMLSCGAGAPSICAATPSALIPSSGGATFNLIASASTVQTYNFNVVAQDSSGLQKLFPVSLIIQGTPRFDFAITNNSGAQTIPAGGQATYSLDVAPSTANFQDVVVLSCSGLPPLSSCGLLPSQIPYGTAGSAAAQLSIATTAPVTASLKSSPDLPEAILAFCLPFPALLLVGVRRGANARFRRSVPLAFLLFALTLISSELACGGGLQGNGNSGGVPGTPATSYAITVTGSSSSFTHSIQVNMTVK